jgi:aspartate racemase
MLHVKKIGILGGMGPVASLFLVNYILKQAAYKYDAVQDKDYPEIVLNSIALSDFDETGYFNKALILQELTNGIGTLEYAKVDIIAIACNTVHYFYNLINKVTPIPILNIVELTVKSLLDSNTKKIGILSSETAKEMRIYTNRFEEKRIFFIETTKEEQQLVNEVIYSVMGQKINNVIISKLESIIARMYESGAQSIVFGCTELSLLYENFEKKYNILDTSRILGDEIIRIAYNDRSQD